MKYLGERVERFAEGVELRAPVYEAEMVRPMPKGTRVHRLKTRLQRKGMEEGPAIATAQKKTGQSYATGKRVRKKGKR